MKKLGMIAALFCASICTASSHQSKLLVTYTLLSCLDGNVSRDKALSDIEINKQKMIKLAKKSQQYEIRNRPQVSAADYKKQNNRLRVSKKAPHQK